jgi:hypothetical protein
MGWKTASSRDDDLLEEKYGGYFRSAHFNGDCVVCDCGNYLGGSSAHASI